MTVEENEQTAPAKEKKGFFRRLFKGLSKSRDNMDRPFRGTEKITDDFWDELEETLVMSDIGARTTEEILDELRVRAKKEHMKYTLECRELLISMLKERMAVPPDAYSFEEGPSIVLVVGVNGVGKTTTVGKLAQKYKEDGKKVLIGAADTFRAAAKEQLEIWAERAGVTMIGGGDGNDPAAVVFDAVSAAKARKADILLVDTAGRLHNRKNLMNELGKIEHVIEREYPEARRENLLVLDGTTGQNALEQAKEFESVVHVDGIVLTKMDGTAKGGIAIAIEDALKIPVKFIGVGETADDLERFDPDEFVRALFGSGDEQEQGEEQDLQEENN